MAELECSIFEPYGSSLRLTAVSESRSGGGVQWGRHSRHSTKVSSSPYLTVTKE